MQGFDIAHYKQTEEYAQAVDVLYNKAVMEFALLADNVKTNPEKPFSFSDYPSTKGVAQNIINELINNLESVVTKGCREQWLYACKKNDEFLSSIMNTSKIPKKMLQKYQDKNLDALLAFQTRKVGGMDLSQRIWNYAGQMKTQMELGIDIALGDGKSAHALSRDLRQYLVDPDKLFRRVRDKHGNLVLSKNAKAFNPGQGKYRSSYKNAMRLTRTEINMAYRESDQLRWQQLDFIVGFEVKLSNNHTLNGVSFVDICDDLAGKYPKTFKFSGWHPQCRCHTVPIMMDRDEFNNDELAELKAAINGTEYKRYPSANEVTDLPDNFKVWAADNKERSLVWKSQPYFIRNNFEGGTLAGVFKSPTIVPVKPIKPAKTIAQKADIQSRWNKRVATNQFTPEIEAIGSQYSRVNAINQYIAKVQEHISMGAPVEVVSTMVDRLKNKAAVNDAWEKRKSISSQKSNQTNNIVQIKVDEREEYKSIIKTEDSIRLNKSFETAVAFDNKGNEVFRKKGAKTSVSFTTEEIKSLKDTIFTHNHPRGWGEADKTLRRAGNSFSIGDVMVAVRADVLEMRAVTPHYTFTLKRPKRGWGLTSREIQKEAEKISNEVRSYMKDVLNKTGWKDVDITRAESIHWHLVWKRFSSKYGFEYTKAKTRE